MHEVFQQEMLSFHKNDNQVKIESDFLRVQLSNKLKNKIIESSFKQPQY